MLNRVPESEKYNKYIEDPDMNIDVVLADSTFMYSEESDYELVYDEYEHTQFKDINKMINSDGYSFDEWYCITEDDLIFSGADDAYNDWVANGEAEMNAIYASHITVTESVPKQKPKK